MTSAVEILFAVGGVRDVQAALGSIGQSLDKLAQRGASAAERSVRTRIKGEQDAARATERSAKDASKAVERIDRDADRERDRRLKEDRRRQDRALSDEMRAVERTARDKERVEQRVAANRERIVTNSLRMEQGIRDRAAREQESRLRVMGRAGSGAIQRGLGIAGRIAGVAGAIGGGFAVADALQAGISQQATAGQIVRSAAETGGLGKADVLTSARDTAIATGGRTDDVLEGLNKFVEKTGDLGKANEFLKDLATQAAAAGVAFTDMGDTSAEVFAKLKEVGEDGKTLEVMRALIGQGMQGSIDIRQLGTYGSRLAAGALQFEGPAAKNIEKLGAVAQLAKKTGSAGDVAEATESVSRLGTDFAKKASSFKDAGINVFSDESHTRLRDVFALISESVVKTKGDLTKLHDLFGERSIRAVEGAQVTYARAGGGGVGGAGEQAINKAFGDVMSYTPTQEALQDKLADKLTETQSKVNIALENFQAAINTKLMPVLPQLIDSFSRAIPVAAALADGLASVVSMLAEHPFAGLGAIVAASIVAEISKAAIGSLVGNGIAKLLGGGGKAMPGGGTIGGQISGALAITATAVTIVAAGVSFIDKLSDTSAKADANVRAAQIEGGNAAALVRAGAPGSSDEAVQRLGVINKLISEGEGYKAGQKADITGGFATTVGEIAGAGLNYATAGSAGTSLAASKESEAAAAHLAELKTQAAELMDALRKAAGAVTDFHVSTVNATTALDSIATPGSGNGPGGQAGPNWPP